MPDRQSRSHREGMGHLFGVRSVPENLLATVSVHCGPQFLAQKDGASEGIVRDGTTGYPIANAREALRPTTGEANPGPINFGFVGIFAWPTLAPGGDSLDVAAPRYLSMENRGTATFGHKE